MLVNKEVEAHVKTCKTSCRTPPTCQLTSSALSASVSVGPTVSIVLPVRTEAPWCLQSRGACSLTPPHHSQHTAVPAADHCWLCRRHPSIGRPGSAASAASVPRRPAAHSAEALPWQHLNAPRLGLADRTGHTAAVDTRE